MKKSLYGWRKLNVFKSIISKKDPYRHLKHVKYGLDGIWLEESSKWIPVLEIFVKLVQEVALADFKLSFGFFWNNLNINIHYMIMLNDIETRIRLFAAKLT